MNNKSELNENSILNSKTTSWVMKEAKKILNKYKNEKEIIFSTGYGASGVPHLGTFSEVFRTLMIKKTVDCIIQEENLNINTKIIIFSDDMDALRKVPTNVPNQELLQKNIGMPLTSVPDPFEKYDSFGEHNNNKLIEFFSFYNIKIELTTATMMYKSGFFNDTLKSVLKNHKQILSIMLPTLGEERRTTYSPFFPVSPKTGRLLETGVIEYKENTIVCKDEDGDIFETEVTDGKCKLQWKVDWPMRWNALNVSYEIYGKDILETYKISKDISKIIGRNAPLGFMYEHYLDDKGGRISKSKGNGFTINQWLRYAPKETLLYFLYKSPVRAKILSFNTIPAIVDEYLSLLEIEFNVDNPIWYFTDTPHKHPGITYNLLLNLANACDASNKNILIEYISKYVPDYKENALLDSLLEGIINYYHDFVLPNKKYHVLTDEEKEYLCELKQRLSVIEDKSDAKAIQVAVYEVGKKFYGKEGLKDWFALIYKSLMGQEQGPRLGSFIKIYGVDKFIQLIEDFCNKK